ncbi:glycogen synthase [Providencia alcalifaciens]|nr:glycogen synthase [Providencia alcalifaciens]
MLIQYLDYTLENLADKTVTGFIFNNYRVDDLNNALRRAFALWPEPVKWKRVQRQAMSINFSWSMPSNDYLNIYQQLV